MKLNSKKQQDIDICLYFMPKVCKNILITEKDIEMYFEWSEQGKHKDKLKQSHFSDGFNALVSAKQWRGMHMEMYEEGVMDGSVTYFTLLGGFENNKKWWQFWKSPHKPIPKYVVNFMKKEMFKGKDAEIIERCYQSLFNEMWIKRHCVYLKRFV